MPTFWGVEIAPSKIYHILLAGNCTLQTQQSLVVVGVSGINERREGEEVVCTPLPLGEKIPVYSAVFFFDGLKKVPLNCVSDDFVLQTDKKTDEKYTFLVPGGPGGLHAWCWAPILMI